MENITEAELIRWAGIRRAERKIKPVLQSLLAFYKARKITVELLKDIERDINTYLDGIRDPLFAPAHIHCRIERTATNQLAITFHSKDE